MRPLSFPQQTFIFDCSEMGVVVAAVLLLLGVVSAEDFCSMDMFPQARSSRLLRFSKELSDAEFAVVGNFMSLHCCAAAFRTVEW